MTANLLHIPQVLTAKEFATVQALLARAEWQQGQAAEDSAVAQQSGAIIAAALVRNARFMSAALPAHIAAPLFNLSLGGETYGAPVDGAIRQSGGQRIRSDLSATLFLSAPEAYDGGEQGFTLGSVNHGFRLAAGDMLLYPAGTLHAVAPVTRGARLVSVLWVQSILRDSLQRQMLYDLDQTIQGMAPDQGNRDALVALTAHYHNLVRMWAEG